MLSLLKRIKTFVDVENMFIYLFGTQIEQVFTTASTDYEIEHKLRRQPIMWIVIDCDTFARFKKVSWDRDSIILQSDTEHTTATIWIV